MIPAKTDSITLTFHITLIMRDVYALPSDANKPTRDAHVLFPTSRRYDETGENWKPFVLQEPRYLER